MKKAGIITSILSLLSVVLVSAQETNLEVWGRTAAGSIARFLDTLRLNPSSLSTILLALLLWMVLYSIISKMKLFGDGSKWGHFVSGIVSIIITILVFIYLPQNFLESIVLQYGAMGAAILSFIPFIIIFYFTTAIIDSLLLSRVIWIFYSLYYLGLFVYKWGLSVTEMGFTESIPYLVAFFAGLIIFFGIKTFRSWIIKGKLEAKEETEKQKQARRKLSRALTEKEYE